MEDFIICNNNECNSWDYKNNVDESKKRLDKTNCRIHTGCELLEGDCKNFISDKDIELKELTCTLCGKVQETHSNIVYSQGDRVCLECKKITLPSDKRAYDRYITNRW